MNAVSETPLIRESAIFAMRGATESNDADE